MAETSEIETQLDNQRTWEKVFILVRFMNITIQEQPLYRLPEPESSYQYYGVDKESLCFDNPIIGFQHVLE